MPKRTPPDVGKNVGVKVDQQLYDELTTLMRTGATVSEAIKWAVELGARLCEQAWKHGYPRGVAPVVISYTLAPYNAESARSTTEGER